MAFRFGSRKIRSALDLPQVSPTPGGQPLADMDLDAPWASKPEVDAGMGMGMDQELKSAAEIQTLHPTEGQSRYAWRGSWDRPMKIDPASLDPLTVARMTDHNVRGMDSREGARDSAMTDPADLHGETWRSTKAA